MPGPLEKLSGGDRRSIGKSNEVVADILREPGLFDALFTGMVDDDPIVRMRAADAIEKITARSPELLQPYKKTLLQKIAAIEQQEVRWHAAQMLPRLELTPSEMSKAVEILRGYLADKSNIVKTCAMQAFADLAERDHRFRCETINLLRESIQKGSPAMKSRGEKLLERLEAS